MIIKSADFISSAVKPSQYPQDEVFEIAFAGRSNVGKSSLLNLLTNRKKLAKVSSSPGKTRTINFFSINNEFRIVDLPGYGFAKVSKSEAESWGPMMEAYLSGREKLVKCILLVDCRHKPSAQDRQMYDYLKYYGLDGVVIATKADKISKNELNKNLSIIRKDLEMEKSDILIPVSALEKTGVDKVLNCIEELLSKAGEEANG
ncbi:MAG: ribosome biogenesis GTP-binding protein YihA/YsxC [Clostridia bacterium]|nr:ribosome biogenesis GTP-binding protein YihA/YsxC [Clostridia bacterium]